MATARAVAREEIRRALTQVNRTGEPATVRWDDDRWVDVLGTTDLVEIAQEVRAEVGGAVEVAWKEDGSVVLQQDPHPGL